MAKLYFYYSAMNAGKSANLLQSNHNYCSNGLRTLLFTPSLDDRYGPGKITSRIGLQADAWIFDPEFDLFKYTKREHEKAPLSCVLIDESQFLTKKQVLQLTLVVDRLDVPVLCYGLRTDFTGEPFEGSKYLLGWADVLVELKCICPSGTKATMNARLDENGERVWEGDQVGIGHNYVSLSRKLFDLVKASSVDYDSETNEAE